MAFFDRKEATTPVDARVAVYRFLKYVVLFAAAALIVKLAGFDTLAVRTDQMAPVLLDGDRVLLLRTPFVLPFSWFFRIQPGVCVSVRHPLLPKGPTCLRIAGLPGDEMTIGKGVFRTGNRPGRTFGGSVPTADALLPQFSPRDSMERYNLPCKGDTVDLDSLSLRDFFFAAAMLRQEHPKRQYAMKVDLFLDGKNANNVPMTKFSLYKGTLDTIPKSHDYDWFFWDRLRAYWAGSSSAKDIRIFFSLFDGSVKIKKYIVKQSFIFLLADDWPKGFDSRYFGPVPVSSIKGKVICVLWSVARDKPGIFPLRTERIMKIVK